MSTSQYNDPGKNSKPFGEEEKTHTVALLPIEAAEFVLRLEQQTKMQGYNWLPITTLRACLATYGLPEDTVLQAVTNRVLVQAPPFLANLTLMLNPEHPTVQAVRYLALWLPKRISRCHQGGMPYVDSAYLARGMKQDRTFQKLRVGQTRQEADMWLALAAQVGLVVRQQHPHPKATDKTVTSWWLPNTIPTPSSEDTISGPLRELVLSGFSEEEVKTVACFDFPEVYQDYTSEMGNRRRVALLVDYAERHQQVSALLDALERHNPQRVQEFRQKYPA